MSRRWSLIAVFVSALCFGTLAVLAPLAYESGARPLPLLAWRFFFAALLLAGVSLVRDPSSLRAGPKDLLRYSLLAVTGYGAASVCFFYALMYADAAVVAVLLYAYPAIVTAAGWLFDGVRVTARRMAAVAVTFIGCALVVGVVGAESHAQWQGVVLGLGAALGYALFSLLSHRWLPGRSRLTVMTYTFGIAMTLPLVATLVTDGAAGLSTAGWSGGTWALLAAIVIFPTFLAVLLYFEGIRRLGASQAAVLSSVEPLFTIALAALVLDQPALAAPQWAGVALVIVGVVTAEIDARIIAEPVSA